MPFFIFSKRLSICGIRLALAAWLVLVTHFASAKSPVDYHAVGRNPSANRPTGRLEAESQLKFRAPAHVQNMRQFGPHWSGDRHILWRGPVGTAMTVSFQVGKSAKYQFEMQMTLAPDYGRFAVLLDDKPIGGHVDLYSSKVELAPRTKLGEVQLDKGEHRLTFKLIGANARAKKLGKDYLLGLDYLNLVDASPKQAKKTAPKIAIELPPPPPATLAELQPVLATYCYRCHGNKKSKGKINLEQLTTGKHLLANIELTRKIAKALDENEMPPEDEKQPPAMARRQITALMNKTIDEYLRTASRLEPVVMRRMNRYEYSNSVRDLLGLKGDIYPLPEKTLRGDGRYFNPASGRFPKSIRVGNRTLGKFQVERPILKGVVPFAIDLAAEHGYNNRGIELSLSPILLESFLKLGQSVVGSPQFEGYCRSYAALFAAPAGDRAQQLQTANARIKSLLVRAFRGPVDADTLDRYTKFFARELTRTDSFPASMKKLVSGVLASPKFLYLVERKGKVLSHEPLTDYELATRLSFFLWSSIPDEALLALARAGKLRDPKTLDQQVRRMLADQRCKALAENFARQWLRLDQLIAAVPDPDRFATYYSRIGCEQWKFGLQTMVEPLLLFESIMVEDRSIMLLVDSNYSYRSRELQSWYKDPKPFGGRKNRSRFNTNSQTFTRQTLASRREGGVITTSAVLTMTSSPLRTNPITRGAWVASVIFNDPPPPPPDSVPEIEADDAVIEAKGLTLRQRLTQHQVNQTCRACHAKIDPLGFALENYDAVGRWRDKYRSGLKIDSSGKLFGDVPFTDIVGFKDAILSRPEKFMRAFSEHLLSYALGRELKVTDQPVVDRIVRQVRSDRGQFSTVVLEVSKSYPFLHKTNPTDKKTEPKK